MKMNEYQAKARAFATGGGATLEYALFGLAEEAGEVCGKAAKFIRATDCRAESIGATDVRDELLKELGDCLWMIANAVACLGFDLDAVAEKNIAKLVDRQNRGVIVGEGDDR